MRVAALALAALAIGASATDSEDGKDWLSSLPTSSEAPERPIPQADFCEVPASKVGREVLQLISRASVALGASTAASFVGGTGHYSLRRIGNDLLISHQSLGRYETYTKPALVVNLPYVLRDVFVVVGSDE
jgi:hypothetical protein